MSGKAPLRFSFQTKVLAPVLAFLVLLPTITLWVVNREISAQALVEARQTLTTADAVFRNSLDIMGRSLATRFRGAVNEPRFRAVAQLADANTMNDFLRGALEEYGNEIELVTYSVDPGKMLAGARHQAHVEMNAFFNATSALAREAFEGEVGTGTIFVEGRPYTVVCIPVPSSDRTVVAGVLTIGLYFGKHSLEELKSLTRTDIAVLSRSRVAETTLPQELLTDSAEEIGEGVGREGHRVLQLQVDGEHFLGLSGEYVAAAGRPGFRYLLLSSYESRLQALRNTQVMLVCLSLVGILISTGCVWMLIRRITFPLRALRDGAEAIGRGDFSHRVERFSNDECGELATTFNRMTDNLLTSRTELQRTVDVLRSTDSRLRQSEEQLRLSIESARDHMICTISLSGRILRWNAAAERMLGYTASEAQGVAYATFFGNTDRANGVPERVLAAAASHGREAFEGWRMRRNGTLFWAEVTISRLPDDAGFVEIAQDNTPRKQAEEAMRAGRDAAEAANRAKTEFIANMSHELRTPMNAIIGMSSLLLDDKLPDETRDCVRTIRTSADSLLELIDDILDISKIEAGRLELNVQPFDLCGCVESVLDLFAVPCNERKIDLVLHVARDLPAVVLGDQGRLRQVLSNMVGNAVKFTERGGVTVSVHGEKNAVGEERVHFSIEDTGIGIPAKSMDRLFKTFSQVDASATRKFGGAGLGLAISQRLVELMDGTIVVESKEGRGSRFSFSIAATNATTDPLPEPIKLDAQKVTVVGADTIAIKTLARQLTTWGAEVVRAKTWENVPGDSILAISSLSRDEAAAAVPGVPTVQLVRFGESRPDDPGEGLFYVAMPLKPRALSAVIRKALRASQPRNSSAVTAPTLSAEFGQLHPLRILLVEDNPVNAKVAQLLLKRLGYKSDWAINGLKALEFAERHLYDAVLMDLQMPEMDGLDATRMLIRTIPESRLPFIIALTANARKDDRDACAAAGMHHFMAKPVQLEKLAHGLALAHAWLRERQQTPA